LKWSQDLRPEFHEVFGSLVIRGRLACLELRGSPDGSSRQYPQRCHSVWPFDWPSRMTFRVIHFVRSGLADRLACSHSIQFSRFRHSGILYVPVPTLSMTDPTVPAGTFALLIRGAPPLWRAPDRSQLVVCSDDCRPYRPASVRMLIIKTALHARSCRAVEAARDRIAPALSQEQGLSCPIRA
jgi:hypothetical protein